MPNKTRIVLKNIDYTLLFFLALLLCAGFVVLRSASVAASVRYGTNFVSRQIEFGLLGFLLIAFLQVIDLSRLVYFERFVYILMNLMLAAVLLIGVSAHGLQGWLELAGRRLQPAEPAKIMLIFCLAQFLSERRSRLRTWRQFLPVLIYAGVPLGLVMLQPDLGTALVFIAIIFGMMLTAGASLWRLLLLFGGGISAVALWIYGHVSWGWWLPLEKYQLMRLIVFVNPEFDPRNWGWNVIQAQITVGSGGMWGQGWGQGAQTASGYLPEQWTDFIFCVLGEEFGFAGCFAVLILFFVLLLRCLSIAGRSKDLFGSLLTSGIVAMLVFHILQNVGMAIGIMPITGIPLPFISYGGSALLANMAAMGMVINVNTYRDPLMF
ncbi:MAG: rod shape-determining protein RodA [Peptococcaceae bacterium]|nr:rod shape-determining protein RodA [Peptococcaceae bacterium]